jgi:hypothetical protein
MPTPDRQCQLLTGACTFNMQSFMSVTQPVEINIRANAANAANPAASTHSPFAHACSFEDDTQPFQAACFGPQQGIQSGVQIHGNVRQTIGHTVLIPDEQAGMPSHKQAHENEQAYQAVQYPHSQHHMAVFANN